MTTMQIKEIKKRLSSRLKSSIKAIKIPLEFNPNLYHFDCGTHSMLWCRVVFSLNVTDWVAPGEGR